MGNLKKELLLNVIVVSPILTLVWAGITTTMKDPTSPTDFGPFVPLVLSFLLLYPFNLFVSFTHYFMARRIHPKAMRLILFNILGLLVSGLVSYFTTTYYLFYPTYSTFVIFSAISFWHKTPPHEVRFQFLSEHPAPYRSTSSSELLPLYSLC